MLNTSNILNSNFANNLSNNSSIITLKNDLSNKTAQITKLQSKYDNLIDKLSLSGSQDNNSLLNLSSQ